MTSDALRHVDVAGKSPLLPLVGGLAPPSLGTPAACSVDDDGCITCGDVAVALTVVAAGDLDAVCRDGDGRREMVATELVGPVVPGDVLLVHAKVALEKLNPREVNADALR